MFFKGLVGRLKKDGEAPERLTRSLSKTKISRHSVAKSKTAAVGEVGKTDMAKTMYKMVTVERAIRNHNPVRIWADPQQTF